MRLNYIKLAGFKSFVDATKVPFPDQMTCVVGPNGCGKSNVIDAVRWVLGESSAKNLRGDAMTDVIFNGSNSRKPVSRASVELVFDNSDGRLQGEYAGYQEISVKRVVSRDGQSGYFLNGSKCRRRDITDLFLGTGLGPRSYAIIEQGMISRLIESRPQELRVFLEEAAGISRYKERRKETENRIRRTQENLERLTDVREELSTQLAKLQRQAAAAKRYKTLKAEERTFKAQLQALRWLQYQQQCDRVEEQLQAQQTELERWIAEQRGSERGQTALRERQAELKQTFDDAQRQFYECNTEITRLEQHIQHQRQMAEQQRRQLDEAQRQRTELELRLAEDKESLAQYEELYEQHLPELEVLQASQDEMAEQVLQAEDKLAAIQEEVQQYEQSQRDRQQKLDLIQVELRGIEQLSQGLRQQEQQYQQKLASLKETDYSTRSTQASQLLEERRERKAQADQALQQAVEAMNDAERTRDESRDQLAGLKAEEHKLEAQRQSYQHLLKNRQPAESEALQQWLENQSYSRLLELLEVEDSWHTAVEVVAGPWLQAAVLTGDDAQTCLADAPLGIEQPGWLLAIDQEVAGQKTTPRSGSLAEVIRGDARHLSLFNQVCRLEKVTASWTESDAWAFAVDRDGILHYRDGRASKSFEKEDSQLLWQQALDELTSRLQHVREQHKLQHEQTDAAQLACKTATEQLEQARTEQRQAEYAEIEQRNKVEQIIQAQVQHDDAVAELEQALEALMLSRAEQEEKQLTLEDEWQRWQAQDSNEQLLLEARQRLEQSRRQLTDSREHQQKSVSQYHQMQLAIQQAEQQCAHTRQGIERQQQALQELTQRTTELQQAPDDEIESAVQQEALAEAIQRREQAETEKTAVADELAGVESELNVLNQGQQGVQLKIDQQRQQVETSKLELAASRERGHTLLEGLQETGFALKDVLETMPEDAEIKAWQTRLDSIARSLQQLGAINLAAIEEAETQAERKAYLDSQYDDLTASLQLLDDAIKKIDKETRQRFRKTFDQVNHDLGELFPKVFGGGSAYLDLTDDDLLETGVTIMARPPGKKNSTIHLLSGGEKALTALSLVFAIFRLNPAPFCMLDEVDAPLDDANVGRFCRLVQEMSESVQFIYISHNKIAMEMATHLAGVTMQEPGVSRLVAVDVDEAVALAEAS